MIDEEKETKGETKQYESRRIINETNNYDESNEDDRPIRNNKIYNMKGGEICKYVRKEEIMTEDRRQVTMRQTEIIWGEAMNNMQAMTYVKRTTDNHMWKTNSNGRKAEK